jgi:hypothetical protein
MLKINTNFDDNPILINDVVDKMMAHSYSPKDILAWLEITEFEIAFIFYTYYGFLHNSLDLFCWAKKVIDDPSKFIQNLDPSFENEEILLLDYIKHEKPWDTKRASLRKYFLLNKETKYYIKLYNYVLGCRFNLKPEKFFDRNQKSIGSFLYLLTSLLIEQTIVRILIVFIESLKEKCLSVKSSLKLCRSYCTLEYKDFEKLIWQINIQKNRINKMLPQYEVVSNKEHIDEKDDIQNRTFSKNKILNANIAAVVSQENFFGECYEDIYKQGWFSEVKGSNFLHPAAYFSNKSIAELFLLLHTGKEKIEWVSKQKLFQVSDLSQAAHNSKNINRSKNFDEIKKFVEKLKNLPSDK